LNNQGNENISRGYLICFTATALWSTTAIIIRYLIQTYQMPPLLLAFWRDSIVFFSLLGIFILFNRFGFRISQSNIPFFLLYGFVLSAFNAVWTISVALNGAAVSTVLAYSSPAFTALLARWLFNEKLDPVKITAILMSFVGCFLIAGAYNLVEWRLNPLGIATGLVSGLLFALYILMGKSSSRRSINPWTAMLYSFGIAAFFLFFYVIMPVRWPEGISSTNIFWLDGKVAGWLVLILLAVGPTLGGYGLYTVSMTYLQASVASLIATLEPVLTALLAYAMLGERFTFIQIVGGIMISLGVVVLRIGERYPQQTIQKVASDQS
jgi:drug/metabolite transporter (DMT)-like permease